MQIEQNHPLAPHTTLRIGGGARYFTTIATESDLRQALHFARANAIPAFILGGGSNLLVSDEGFPGLVIRVALPSKINSAQLNNELIFHVSAGCGWDEFVLYACGMRFTGVECLAGIPGLVGASPIQNIGAYGQEVGSTIRQVHALDLETFKFVTLSHADCGFSYRTSIFNTTHRNRYVITGVDFALSMGATPNLSYADLAPLRGTNPTPLDVYHAVRAIRDRKAMVIHPGVDNPDTRSAGSFFKNPLVPTQTLTHIAQTLAIPTEKIPHWPAPSGQIKLPAAWLIEQAGFIKGFALSPDAPAAISTRHTLALTNRSGTATCTDLLNLRDHIIEGIRTRFHITLDQEPVFLK